MFGCKCFCWNRAYDVVSPEPEPFSLPAPIPQWPEGCRDASKENQEAVWK